MTAPRPSSETWGDPDWVIDLGLRDPRGRGYDTAITAALALRADLRALGEFTPIVPGDLKSDDGVKMLAWLSGYLAGVREMFELLVPPGVDPERWVDQHQADDSDLGTLRAWAEFGGGIDPRGAIGWGPRGHE